MAKGTHLLGLATRRNIIGGWLTRLYNIKAEEETVAAGKKDVKSNKKFP